MKRSVSVVLVSILLSVPWLFPSMSWAQAKGMTGFSMCNSCEKACEEVIKNMPEVIAGCDALDAAFFPTCEILFGDSGIGSVLCAAGATATGEICAELTWHYMKTNPDKAAEKICQKIKLCR
jgi:hypothetical protein